MTTKIERRNQIGLLALARSTAGSRNGLQARQATSALSSFVEAPESDLLPPTEALQRITWWPSTIAFHLARAGRRRRSLEVSPQPPQLANVDTTETTARDLFAASRRRAIHFCSRFRAAKRQQHCNNNGLIWLCRLLLLIMARSYALDRKKTIAEPNYCAKANSLCSLQLDEAASCCVTPVKLCEVASSSACVGCNWRAWRRHQSVSSNGSMSKALFARDRARCELTARSIDTCFQNSASFSGQGGAQSVVVFVAPSDA